MRGVDRLLFSAQAMRNAARQAPEHLVIGVYDVPIAGDVLRPGGIGFHGKMTRSVNFCKVLDNSTLTEGLSNRGSTRSHPGATRFPLHPPKKSAALGGRGGVPP